MTKPGQSVWPMLCIGLVICRVKLKDSIKCMNSQTSGLEEQQMWILKSPRIKTRSKIDMICDKRSANCEIKLFCDFCR